MAKKGSKAYKTAKKAGDKINKSVNEEVGVIDASMKDGLLKLFIPLTPESKPQIRVQHT